MIVEIVRLVHTLARMIMFAGTYCAHHTRGGPSYPHTSTTVPMYTYTSIRGSLVYTLITLLRKEVFCLKVEARTEQRKGTGE